MNGTAAAGAVNVFVVLTCVRVQQITLRVMCYVGRFEGYGQLIRHFLKIKIVHKSRVSRSSLKSFEDES